MIETFNTVDSVTGVRSISLYSEMREPTEEMLVETDVLVFDMQDVPDRISSSTRWRIRMRAETLWEKRLWCVIVQNPINGDQVAGNMTLSRVCIFVGCFAANQAWHDCGRAGANVQRGFWDRCELVVSGWRCEQWFGRDGCVLW